VLAGLLEVALAVLRCCHHLFPMVIPRYWHTPFIFHQRPEGLELAHLAGTFRQIYQSGRQILIWEVQGQAELWRERHPLYTQALDSLLKYP